MGLESSRHFAIDDKKDGHQMNIPRLADLVNRAMIHRPQQ